MQRVTRRQVNAVKAIQESRWAQGEARGLCRLSGQETLECIERVSRKLAEGMLRKQKIDKEKREERISFEKMWG